MAITDIPELSDFGAPKSSAFPVVDAAKQIRADDFNEICQRVIDVHNAVGLDDGSTSGSLRRAAALSVKGNATNTTGAVADIAAASDGHVLRRSGTSIGFGTIATAGIADGAVTGAKIVQSGTLDIGAASITTTGNLTSALLKSGAGSPEGVTTADVGAIYCDTTNGWLWQKESGSGNTGWRIIGASGTYTPTATVVSNLDSVTPNSMAWTRVGNVVFVEGLVSVDPTAAGTVSYRITLPVASNFSLARQLNGTCITTVASIGFVTGDATNDAALVTATNAVTTSHSHIFTFGYEVI